MAEEELLASHLCEMGLDRTEFWLSQLKKHGVQSKASLAYLEGHMTTFYQLKKEAQFHTEKMALRKLLKIDEFEEKRRVEKEEKYAQMRAARASNREIAKEKSEKIKQELQARDEEAKKVLKELQEARAEGMKRTDDKVQTLEREVRDHLQINSDTWLANDKSLDELIKKLEEHSGSSAQVQARDWLNEKVLLQKCSSGRALQGILVSKRASDQLEDRSRLLEPPDSVVLTGANQSLDKIVQFSSAHQENEFKKAVDILGLSIALSPSVPVHGAVAVTADQSASRKKKNETTQEQHTKEIYSSTVKFSTMQVASYSFEKKDYQLSGDAQDELRELHKLVKIKGQGSGDAVQQTCEKFFRSFGSHVNRGPLGFGGKFCWTCSSRGFSQKKKQTVEAIQSCAISTSFGISFAGCGISTEVSIKKTKGSFKGKGAEDIFATTSFQVRIDGGPPETNDLSLWKKGLVANNSTWILTDRGTKLIPVWEIIKMNHNKEFGEIRDVLQSAWENMTGLKSEPDVLSILSYDSDDVLQQVSQWSKEKEMTPQQIQDKLEYLLEVKSDVINKTSDKSYWISEYLSHFEMQRFVMLLTDLESQSGHVRSLMQQLIEEDDLKHLSTLVFPSIEAVSEYLYSPSTLISARPEEDISDFEELEKFLTKTLEDGRIAELENEVFDISTKVSKAINSLQSHCRQTYDEILISILVYPYQSASFDGVVTLKLISLENLECLLKSFAEQKKKFNIYIKKSPFHLQAYLFYLAVEQYQLLVEPSPFLEYLGQLKQMMKHVDVVDEDVRKCLKAYLRGGHLQIFKQSLYTAMTSSKSAQAMRQQPSHPVTSENSLLSILKTASRGNEGQATEATGFSLDFTSNPEACELLEKLGLRDFYPKKLGLQDALCIRPDPLQMSLSNKPPTDPKQLPHLILHKLMSYDPLCRSDLMPANPGVSSNQPIDDFDDFDDFDDDVSGSLSGIHPVDGLLALIMCSDDFLCQDLLSRLAKCQLAIPFLLPDPFSNVLTLPLWAMRTIVKEWKSTNSNEEIVQHACPIVSYKMPVISFIRVGKHQDHGKSKSKILNDVLSDSHCDHFFHRDCPGGQQATLLGKGLVDMCWYLPAGKPSDAFSDAVTFLNLHGDAREHQCQCRFLSQISFMCFVLLTEKDVKLDSQTLKTLNEFSLCAGGITILNDVDERPMTLRHIPKIRLIQLRERNASQVKNAIQALIKSRLAGVGNFGAIESLCAMRDERIMMDENGSTHRKGLKLADDLKGIVTTYTTKKPSLKDAMLPLQGEELWKAWAASDKELNRQTLRGRTTVNDYTAEIESDKDEIRKQQLKYIASLSPVMKSFVTSLLKLGGSHNTALRNYYFQCLKLEFNNLSRENISDMQQQYHSARKTLAILEAGSDCRTKDCEKLKMKLIELQEAIIDSSFGLEHLFRELGQIYEAALASHQYDKAILTRLPRAAAELLIDGYPLELMDGDTAHVPLGWVTAVLEQTVEMLDDSKVFVLSVLGLQSTGKSTMLNTAFGLQFNVSAGRCTRGAFMQLVPFDEALQEKTKCRYVLVVDTEGLRAPELDSSKTQKHDNELATFVIGLANMTFINIYGEVAGDMDDILQTSVHAFLRMTQVKYNPSCQFVHQNAGANLNSEVGRAKFTQKLNQFTVDAAKQENCVENYKCFNDVINFDDQNDAHHFPGLWKGDPPMAPVNQGYSYSAQMLKQHFIQYICKRASKNENVSTEKSIGDLSLSSFHGRIIDLWKSLLKEKFVFSFKNTLEIAAYNSLETAYGEWEWKFRQKMLEWERKAENTIDAMAKTALHEVPKLVKQKRQDLHIYVANEVLKPIKDEMKVFFSGKQSETLAQWKAKFERRLGNLEVELKSHADKLCMQLKKSKEIISKFESDREKYAKIITKAVYEHIASVRRGQERLVESLQRRKLEPQQLKKILERNLFTPENLMTYRECDIITEDQKSQIDSMIQSCGGQLTEVYLREIVVKILRTEQLMKILKKGRQTKAELKRKFDQIWIDLVNLLDVISGEQVEVEAELEEALINKMQYLEGHLIRHLQKKSLREWGDNLAIIPKEGEHFFVFREGSKQSFSFCYSSGNKFGIKLSSYQKK